MAAIQKRDGETIYSFPGRTIILSNCCWKRKHKLSHVYISPPLTFIMETRNNKYLVWIDFREGKSCLKVIGINPYSNLTNYHIISSSSPYCGNISIKVSRSTAAKEGTLRNFSDIHLDLFRRKKTSALFQ